jgi:hypothetical protein
MRIHFFGTKVYVGMTIGFRFSTLNLHSSQSKEYRFIQTFFRHIMHSFSMDS